MPFEVFPNGALDQVQCGLAANLPSAPLVPPSGANFAFYYATDTAVLYIWNTKAGAWQSKNPAPVAVTTAAATAAAVDGVTYFLNRAAGAALTLPLSTGSGITVSVVVGITATSNAYKVLAGRATDYLIGNVTGQNAGTPKQFSAAHASTFCSLQMPFSGTQPSGGFEGDWFDLVDVAANTWLVAGMFQAGTTPTTPFNTATS